MCIRVSKQESKAEKPESLWICPSPAQSPVLMLHPLPKLLAELKQACKVAATEAPRDGWSLKLQEPFISYLKINFYRTAEERCGLHFLRGCLAWNEFLEEIWQYCSHDPPVTKQPQKPSLLCSPLKAFSCPETPPRECYGPPVRFSQHGTEVCLAWPDQWAYEGEKQPRKIISA